MPETGRTIRGLSIAITVLAGLAIVAAMGMAALSGLLAIGLVDDDYGYSSHSGRGASISIDDLDLSPSDIRELRDLGIDIDDIEISYSDGGALAAAIVFFLGLGAFGGFVVGALSLVAGILGIIRWQRPDKMQTVFIWAIVAAVFSLLIGRLISLVLLIILAVEAYKYRRDYMNATMYDSAQGWTA